MPCIRASSSITSSRLPSLRQLVTRDSRSVPQFLYLGQASQFLQGFLPTQRCYVLFFFLTRWSFLP